MDNTGQDAGLQPELGHGPGAKEESAGHLMNAWFRSPLGQTLLAQEKAHLQRLLGRRFGYHLLQLGCCDVPMYDSSPIGHCFSLCPHLNSRRHGAIASPEALPLASESIDLVILHHALDFADNPHQVLREASRVLIAGGHLIIIGFNPISSWGFRSRLQGLFGRRRQPWSNQRLTSLRVNDWLKLLELQEESTQYAAHCLPVNHQRVIRYSSIGQRLASYMNWPTGGVYIIDAKKEVAPLTPIQHEWRRFPMPVGVSAAKNIRSASRQQRLGRNPRLKLVK